MRHQFISEKENLRIEEYANAFARPVGEQQIICIYNEQGEYVPYTFKRKYGKAEYAVPELCLPCNPNEIEYIDEEVVYLGFFRGHWGHFMVDSSVRLWALDKPECRNKKVLVKIEGMEEFYRKLFAYLGIKQEQVIQLKETVRFKKILVPDLAYFPEEFISKEFIAPYKRVADQIRLDKKVYDKIYLSRVRFAKKKKELGERQIQRIFEKNGYQILYPEELSYEEQVWYYKNCKEVVTTNGTVAHNVIYAHEGTKLVLLKRFADKNVHQLAINQIKNIDYTEINCYDKKSDHKNSLMKRTPELIDFCKRNKMIIPKESFWTPIYYSLIFRIPYLYKCFK